MKIKLRPELNTKKISAYLELYSWQLLFLISCLLFLPWLGETLFNTKGEPREAVVALTMLKSGNWILPVSFENDIPYKPPFLAWCITLCSYLTGGINEYSSRLPSSIATISLIMLIYSWLRSQKASKTIAFTTGLVFMSTIEVWRAAAVCRVDMVLTVCMVGAMISIFNFIENNKKALPWIAILLMTCAVLTKGPIGMLLPCLCGGLYGLLRKRNLWWLLWRFSLCGFLSCILPALWYIAAYRMGGDQFYNLVMEENFGRFTGTMSYASHENPVWYNFQTVALGMLPYTILAIMGLWAVNWKKIYSVFYNKNFVIRIKNLWRRIIQLDPVSLYSLTVTVIVFIFYCIPKSKRSVYLLPIYPFLAYFIVLLSLWLFKRKPILLNIFARTMAIICIIVPILAIILSIIPLSQSINYRLGHASGMIHDYQNACNFWSVIILSLPIILGICLFSLFLKKHVKMIVYFVPLTVIGLLLSLSAAILPPILSSKSDKYIASDLQTDCPEGRIYMFIDDPMLRFYTVNFYLEDRLSLLQNNKNDEGSVLVGESDLPALHEKFDGQYTFEGQKKWHHKSCDTKSNIILLRFKRK